MNGFVLSIFLGIEKKLSLCHKLWFSNPEIFATQCRGLWFLLDQIIKSLGPQDGNIRK